MARAERPEGPKPLNNPAQFKASSIIPTASTPEWSVWVKGDTAQTTLTSLSGQMAYLVKCSGLAADTYTVAITQRILPPKSTWVRNGANFLGFPALAGTSAPTLSSYFATFPAAIASNADRVISPRRPPSDRPTPAPH
jgi:hypothetical protein